jgi:hypothetical protein
VDILNDNPIMAITISVIGRFQISIARNQRRHLARIPFFQSAAEMDFAGTRSANGSGANHPAGSLSPRGEGFGLV